MRAGKALSVIIQKSSVSLLLMLGATSVIFFSLRAAPGTAVDAYASLNTPKEELAQLRQELGFTIVEPLRSLKTGQRVADIRVDGAFEGRDRVKFVIELLAVKENAAVLSWWKDESLQEERVVLQKGMQLLLTDGFAIRLQSLMGLEVGDQYVFEAISLDDKPLRAFFEWLAKVAVGDFGQSQVISQGESVMAIAAPAFARTLLLAVASLAMCMMLGAIIVLTRTRHSHGNRGSWFASLTGSSPSFVVGLFVMLFVNQVVYFYWNPEVYIPPKWWPLPKILEGQFFGVPALFAGLSILLGDGLLADFLNGFRSDYGRVRSAPFIAAIRSKGASVTRHLVRNMVVPMVDAFAGRLPLVLGSVIIVENMFGLSGGGWYLLEAAKERDVPLVVGLSVLFTGTGILVSLFADVVKTVVDPREADNAI